MQPVYARSQSAALGVTLGWLVGLSLDAPFSEAQCELARLEASNGQGFDEFGMSISAFGDAVLVGSVGLGDPAPGRAAYVYRESGNSWLEEQILLPPDEDIAGFGARVALGEGVALVSSDNAVHVFERLAGVPTWVEVDRLLAPDERDRKFGVSVSLHGDVAVVGAPLDDAGCPELPICHSGAAYVFRFNGLAWTLEQKLVAVDAPSDAFLGMSVAAGPDRMVIGAPYEEGVGAVYVFAYNGTQWLQEARLTALGAVAGDEVGWSVDLADDIVVVGARQLAGCLIDPGRCGSGTAYVFTRNGGSWDEGQQLFPTDGVPDERFGSSVAVRGNQILVGAPQDTSEGVFSGAALVFTHDGGEWSQELKLTPSNGQASDRFGTAVAIGGSVAAIGAPSASGTVSHAGAAYIYGIDTDCNANNVADRCDVAKNVSDDCNLNNVPDECESNEDCNSNGVSDLCDIGSGDSADCNDNGIPDECDVLLGVSPDQDQDGILDECCVSVGLMEVETLVASNRFLSFFASVPRSLQAVRVTLVSLPEPFDGLNGQELWLAEPEEITELSGVVDPGMAGDWPTFWTSTLACEPFYTDWRQYGTVHVYHEVVIPGGVYELRAIKEGCGTTSDVNFSTPLATGTSEFGNVVGPFDPVLGRWTEPEPDGAVDITTDVISAIQKFGNAPGAPAKVRVDLDPETPDFKINIIDIVRILDAFRGLPYPFTPSTIEPCG